MLRRTESALLGEDIRGTGLPSRTRSGPLALGCVLTAIVVAGCAVLGLLRPQVALDRAQIVVSRESGALFVRVGDVWHPLLNLASARLIAATAATPQAVTEADLGATKRGPLLGIPGAPQYLGTPLSPGDTGWSICASTGASTTTVIIGRRSEAPAVHRLAAGHAILVAPASGSPAYLLYDGHRAMVDLDDAAAVRALRIEGRSPLIVSEALLNAMPEAPPIAPPRIRGRGTRAPGLPGFAVGSVLRITRADGDEYYAVLAAGVQRIGQVARGIHAISSWSKHATSTRTFPIPMRSTGQRNTLSHRRIGLRHRHENDPQGASGHVVAEALIAAAGVLLTAIGSA
ncbi:hypothetical protein MTY59_06190 [Mycobacterium senriense]|uniref:Type VII secretion protein EccB n=1 Tax=Mycobacterium senriense TaxID=2775496 RepID=A0ABM7SI58_9MYCO|nr:hypothetical protein MTY59_06190 [Mycobacterium senriense]